MSIETIAGTSDMFIENNNRKIYLCEMSQVNKEDKDFPQEANIYADTASDCARLFIRLGRHLFSLRISDKGKPPQFVFGNDDADQPSDPEEKKVFDKLNREDKNKMIEFVQNNEDILIANWEEKISNNRAISCIKAKRTFVEDNENGKNFLLNLLGGYFEHNRKMKITDRFFNNISWKGVLEKKLDITENGFIELDYQYKIIIRAFHFLEYPDNEKEYDFSITMPIDLFSKDLDGFLDDNLPKNLSGNECTYKWEVVFVGP